jgi:sulfur-oxidizing protein SoxB
MGQRISEMRLRGKPLEAGKQYKVAGWAPVAEGASGEPIWELMARYLRGQKTVTSRVLNQPAIKGAAGNPGMAGA